MHVSIWFHFTPNKPTIARVRQQINNFLFKVVVLQICQPYIFYLASLLRNIWCKNWSRWCKNWAGTWLELTWTSKCLCSVCTTLDIVSSICSILFPSFSFFQVLHGFNLISLKLIFRLFSFCRYKRIMFLSAACDYGDADANARAQTMFNDWMISNIAWVSKNVRCSI